MLRKLLKYDLKWCFKPLIVFYILTIIFSVIVRIVENFEQTLIILIIDKICCGITISMMINIIINCFMRNWVRFIRNIYKDESYLTHTLPVSKNKIYLSKILTAIVSCIAIGALNKDTYSTLTFFLEESANSFNISIFSLIISFVLTIFLETLFMYMCGLLGIIIGYKSNNLKLIKSIVIGFIIYMMFSGITILVIFGIGLINSDIMSLFNNVNVETGAIKSMMIIAIFVYFIYNAISYFIGNKLLNKGVNVD